MTPSKNSPLIFISLVFLLVFCWIEVDLYAPGLPQLRQHFATTEAMIQLTLSLNFAGFFLSSLVVGPLSDSCGRRPILLGGACLFVLGSLACVLATNLTWLLLGRFIQGLGVSAPSILAMAVIGDLYDANKQVRLFSLVNSLVTLTMAGAPILGAFLSDRYGWRSNFTLILAGSLGATLAVMGILPESLEAGRRSPFSAGKLVENYRTLLGNRYFLSTAFGLVLLTLPYMIFVTTIPFLFLEVLCLPMSRYVFYQAAVVGMFAFLSLAATLLVEKVDPHKMTILSLVVAVLAAFLLCLHGFLLPDAALGITGLMCLYVMGIVWPCSCLFTNVFVLFPGLKGSAVALFTAIRMVVMAFGLVVSGLVYRRSFRSVGILILILAVAAILLLTVSLRERAFHASEEGNGVP